MEDHYEIAMDTARTITYGLNLKYQDTRLAYMTYSDTANLHFDFERYRTKEETIEAIYLDRVSGDTNIDEALNQLRTLFQADGKRSNVRQIAILISDGKLESGVSTTLNNAFKLRQDASDLEIFAIGIGSNINRMNLNDIASQPSSRYRYDIAEASDVGEKEERGI